MKSTNDQLSFRPDMPGHALMELLYRLVVPGDRVVAISNEPFSGASELWCPEPSI